MRRARLAPLICAAAALLLAQSVGGRSFAQADRVRSLALTDRVPTDPQITQGQLKNGLRYYVRPNAKPEKRAELRLVVKAGSILEDDDQQGLAHFVEHMAFNGTAHFPKDAVLSFLQSLGMRFGADVNAYTGFDETVFILQVPTDRPGVLDRAFLILEDWAHNVTFDPVEIDRERGVVVEEWRLRRGAGARMQERLLPTLLKGSRYADRVPIGQMDVVRTFKPARLKRFYTDWYRPDLMAVVAVGDFDRAATEKLVRDHFSSLSNPARERPRPGYGVPDHAGTVYAIQTDKELTTTSVAIENLLPARPDGALGAYRQKIVDRIFSSLIAGRLAELSKRPDAPFITAFANRTSFLGRTKDVASLTALVKDGGAERGLAAALEEIERVTRFGFTQTELDRQKQTILRGWERILAEKNNTLSSQRADEYVRNYLTGETLPTIDDEYAMTARFMPGITLAEINRVPAEWFPGDANRMVIVNAPEKPGVAVPTNTTLAAAIAAARSKSLTAYVDKASGSVLLESLPSPGTIVRTTVREELGITEWELSNGVKVALKPTTFKQDEVVFRAMSPGGTSLASDEDFIPASSAAAVVAAGGLGNLGPSDLRKVLTGKIASANPYISELEEGLNGGASARDLDTLFQLIYMRFTRPRADAGAVAAQAAQLKSLLANQSATPGFAFAQALVTALTGNHPRRRIQTAASIDRWNLDKSFAFYKERFADASDFTFVFVGSFDLATMKPLVERYLGSLPSLHRQESWRDVGVRLASGVIRNRVEKGIEPKSQAAIVFTGVFKYDEQNRAAIRALAEILQTRLRETIREELGGTYSIGANASYHGVPVPEFELTIAFSCDPARLDELVARVMQEIEGLKKSGPSAKQVADEREALLRDFETGSKQNGYLLNQLSARYISAEDPASIWALPDTYRALDVPAIQQAAARYLNEANRVEITLVPEKQKP